MAVPKARLTIVIERWISERIVSKLILIRNDWLTIRINCFKIIVSYIIWIRIRVKWKIRFNIQQQR